MMAEIGEQFLVCLVSQVFNGRLKTGDGSSYKAVAGKKLSMAFLALYILVGVYSKNSLQ